MYKQRKSLRKKKCDCKICSENYDKNKERQINKILNNDWSGMGNINIVKKLLGEIESQQPTTIPEKIRDSQYVVQHHDTFININELMWHNGVLSKKFKKACDEIGVVPVITNMHFKITHGAPMSIIDTFIKIFKIIENQ